MKEELRKAIDHKVLILKVAKKYIPSTYETLKKQYLRGLILWEEFTFRALLAIANSEK